MSNTPIRIATRRSKLAMWQAEHVQALLRSAHPELPVELVPMSTQGDRVLDRALAEVGGKGLFVKELEVAMQHGRADVAVHSMKDVPSELPPGFAIVAVLPRANPLDAFISRKYARFDELPRGARVGTSSPRRQSQLRRARADLKLELLRGNVDTRLRRLDEGGLDAILLACAGLERLGIAHHVTEQLGLDLSLPAVGQGVIGIECRADDVRSREALAALHHAESFARLNAERAFAATLGGSCHSPIAAHATLEGDTLTLRGFIGAPDGTETYRDELSGPAAQAESLGRELARRMQAAGAEPLLERLRQEAAAAT
ncbi:MAG TPA: hydroxymethylbilane synthase [Steroidobacteraceae bacterium]|nr:hydroxymethylbilane synthase [Steroidobacteraceae bacterium]